MLEERYPPVLAEEWDAVGLTVGDPDASVHRVLFAIDPVAVVVETSAPIFPMPERAPAYQPEPREAPAPSYYAEPAPAQMTSNGVPANGRSIASSRSKATIFS